MKLPEHGLSKDAIHQKWNEYTINDMNWKDGKFFGYVLINHSINIIVLLKKLMQNFLLPMP